MAVSDDGEDFSHVFVLTAEEVLSFGIQVALFSNNKINRVNKIDSLSSTTNHQHFKDHFGVSHASAAQIWEDLQTTGVSAENLTVKNLKKRRIPKELNLFLHSLVFLKQ